MRYAQLLAIPGLGASLTLTRFVRPSRRRARRRLSRRVASLHNYAFIQGSVILSSSQVQLCIILSTSWMAETYVQRSVRRAPCIAEEVGVGLERLDLLHHRKPQTGQPIPCSIG